MFTSGSHYLLSVVLLLNIVVFSDFSTKSRCSLHGDIQHISCTRLSTDSIVVGVSVNSQFRKTSIPLATSHGGGSISLAFVTHLSTVISSNGRTNV